ncbi:8166_t:CDS:1, partial [Cetraspora pellucida]
VMSEHIKEDIYSTTLLTIKTYSNIYYNTQITEGAVKLFEDLAIFLKIHTCKRCQNLMRKFKDCSRIDGQKW